MTLSHVFCPALPTNDFAVFTRTSVTAGAAALSHTPTVSPPDPTIKPTLRGRAPSTCPGSCFLMSNPLTVSASTAARWTLLTGWLKTVAGFESSAFGDDAQPTGSPANRTRYTKRSLHIATPSRATSPKPQAQ